MLDDAARTLATGRNYAALTTLFADGRPQTQLVWIDSDGEHLLVNTEIDHQKYRNAKADPRVTVMLLDSKNPYRYIEVRGRVVGEEGGRRARDHIDELSRRHTGEPYGRTIRTERVILKIAPERIHSQG
jgi:PPOX class probable F420-dependent enzyme